MRATFNYTFFIVLAFFSCDKAKQELKPVELIQWTESKVNNLVHEKILNQIVYRLQYMPTDYVVLKEFDGGKVVKTTFEKRKKEIENYHHFLLRIKVHNENTDPLTYGITDQQEYSKRDLFYGFEFNQHIKKVELNNYENDTLQCELFHFMQTHGLTPYMDFVFAFKKQKNESDFEIVIDDPVFNNGFMKFHFNNEDLNNIPGIKLDYEN